MLIRSANIMYWFARGDFFYVISVHHISWCGLPTTWIHDIIKLSTVYPLAPTFIHIQMCNCSKFKKKRIKLFSINSTHSTRSDLKSWCCTKSSEIILRYLFKFFFSFPTTYECCETLLLFVKLNKNLIKYPTVISRFLLPQIIGNRVNREIYAKKNYFTFFFLQKFNYSLSWHTLAVLYIFSQLDKSTRFTATTKISLST